jgi:VanZ family protein
MAQAGVRYLLKLNKFFKYHFPFILWMVIIFVQSSLPAIELPPVDIIGTDKLIHAGIYGLLGALCYISLIHVSKENIFTRFPLIWTAIIVSLYGASDEYHQSFVPYRSAEVLDWVADAVGAILIVLLIRYFLMKRFKFFGKIDYES